MNNDNYWVVSDFMWTIEQMDFGQVWSSVSSHEVDSIERKYREQAIMKITLRKNL